MSHFVIELPNLSDSNEYILQVMSEMYDWGLIDLNIPQIHLKTQGENIKIGIVDSGKSEHFETLPNTVAWKNFTTEPQDTDLNGHSTFVSGIVAAAKNNEGIVGIAPKSKLYFAKAMDNAGRGSPAAMVNAINWLISEQVDIISISAGMFFDFKPLHQAVKLAYSKNITIVAAVGNVGDRYYDVAYPARYPEVIGVAAYDQRRTVAPFSSRGINVKFALPGVDIYSTYLDNQFVKNSGTSFSAPILTGICALILSKHRTEHSSTPCDTPAQMFEHLKKYSIKLGEARDTGFGTIDTEKLFDN